MFLHYCGLLEGSQGVGEKGIGFHPSSLDVVSDELELSFAQFSIGAGSQSMLLTSSGVSLKIKVSAISDPTKSHGSVSSFPSIHKGTFRTLSLVIFLGIGANVSSLSWAGHGAEGIFFWNFSTFFNVCLR